MTRYHLIFETISGSQLYGTAVRTSDVDYRGVGIEDKESLLGFHKFEEEVLQSPTDRTIFSLRKFLNLALDGNPNIVELLFAPTSGPTCVYTSEVWGRIIFERECFLSQKIRKTFVGYAYAQLKKMEVHYKWMTSETPDKPDPKDYGQWTDDGGDENWSSHTQYQEYQSKKKTWENYFNWLSNRNKTRHETEVEWGYDCYTDDTEFLTNSGWKLYDDITDGDKLGTINEKDDLIFQNFTERVRKPFIGDVYNVKTLNTDVRVTNNHRMLVSRCHRKPSNGYNCKPDGVWSFIPLKNLKNGEFSYYHIKSLYNNINEEYNITDDELILTGFYISEGTINFRNGKVKTMIISQTNHGKKELIKLLDNINYKFKKYEYKRKHGNNIIEYKWHFDKNVSEYFYKKCGHLSKGKHLPDYFTMLSKRQANLLLKCLLLGDGTKSKTRWTYYTNNELLAGQIQILSNLSGYNATIKNYIEKYKIIQIFISNFVRKTNLINTKINITEEYYDGNIVCFTVPNETLITRRNGKIALQGNTKFGMHAIRLLSQGIELLETGNLTLPRPDAQELLAIRNGKYQYPDLVTLAEAMLSKLDNTKSDLPEKPDYDAIENLCIDIHESYLKGWL